MRVLVNKYPVKKVEKTEKGEEEVTMEGQEGDKEDQMPKIDIWKKRKLSIILLYCLTRTNRP